MADCLSKWLDEGHDVYAYFNNDDSGYAVRDAPSLAGQLQSRSAPHDPLAAKGNRKL
jgi:uncharacterized protein YecE (DUF72 family)